MTLKKILEGRWFGHPLHPLIVHLPLGLWLLATILDVVAFAGGRDQSWARDAAGWALLVGTAAAILAAITGLNDWLDIRNDHPAQKAALWHMALMIPATVLYTIDTVLHFAIRPGTPTSALLVGLSIFAYLLCIVGGYVGGLLVYDEGIAVGRHRRTTSLPQNTIYQPRKGTTETALAPANSAGEQFHPVVPDAALAEGQTLRIELEGHILMLARAAGRVTAVQEFCTHRYGPLSEGAVEMHEGNACIRCPWHNSRFDLATGKVLNGPAKVDLKTFPVSVRNGIIHVSIPPATPPAETTPDTRLSPRRNPDDTGHARDESREESERRAHHE